MEKPQKNFYPTVIDSNHDKDNVNLFSQENTKNSFYPSPDQEHTYPQQKSSNSNSLYPTISMEDMEGNNACFTNTNEEGDTATAPIEAGEEVMLSLSGAIVHLIDKEQSYELATGDFRLVRLLQGGDPVAIFARIGDDIQWPLAKDEAAVKLDENHYFFSLRVPAEVFHEEEDVNEISSKAKQLYDNESILNYGVTFAAKGQENLLRDLDRFLDEHSYFTVRSLSQRSGVLSDDCVKEISPTDLVKSEKTRQIVEGNCAAYWTTLAPNVEDYSHSVARGIASGSGHIIRGILWCGDVTVDRLRWGNEFMKKSVNAGEKASEISPDALKRIKRAKKVSKMSHKVAKGVLSGVVKVSGVIASSVATSKAGKQFFSMLPGEVILASVDGFVRVFDALEVAGKNVLKTSSDVTTDVVNHRYGEQAAGITKEGLGAAGHMIGTAWTVAKIRKAFNPKSVVDPKTLAKTAAKEAAKSAKSSKSSKSMKKEKQAKITL